MACVNDDFTQSFRYQKTGFLSSAIASAEKKVDGLFRSLGGIHPDRVVTGNKVGDVPEEPRQWSAFEYADLLEKGLSGGHATCFMQPPQEEVSLFVEQSENKKDYFLTTNDDAHLLLARLNDDASAFEIFIASDGVAPRSLGPSFTLAGNAAKDRWALYANRCDECEGHCRRSCGSRELARIRHYKEHVADAEICCMDVEIPAVTQDGALDVWCPVCMAQGTERQSLQITTRRPWWNARKKALMLDFFGRCSLASVRNFQLEGEPEEVSLLFGKIGEGQYVLDFNSPLCVIQAFAAALSAFVWK